MNEKKETSNIQHKDDHVPTSCELMLHMLASPPATYEPAPVISFKIMGTMHNSYNTTDNLARAYFACQNRLEISPLLSTSEYSIFINPKQAEEHAAGVKVLKQHGKI